MTGSSRLARLLVLLPVLVLCSHASENPRQPNIVLILADDLGRECLGAYGGTSYPTPHLDRLAREGALFTNVFSTPRCSPSRVTLLTGRYTFRSTTGWGQIPSDEVTFGHVLQDAGYATGLAGKWQLGHLRDDPQRVTRAGFGHNSCWGWEEGPRYWQPMIWQDGEIRDDVADRYGPDVYREFLVDFIEKNREGPFLAYYPMTLPHTVFGGEPKGPHGRWETFAEMVTIMDAQVGSLVAALDRLGLREETLILFTSDNGSPTHVISQLADRSVRGGKDLHTDAGTRVPLIANWPGVIETGAIHDELIDLSDFLPTFAELAGTALPADRVIDGHSFAGTLLGRPAPSREWVYTLWRDRSWVRDAEWKLYDDGELYDMRRDDSEKHPIDSGHDTAASSAARRKLQSVFDRLGPGAKPGTRRKGRGS
jgi:arylsulfatase A-like enzyme